MAHADARRVQPTGPDPLAGYRFGQPSKLREPLLSGADQSSSHLLHPTPGGGQTAWSAGGLPELAAKYRLGVVPKVRWNVAVKALGLR